MENQTQEQQKLEEPELNVPANPNARKSRVYFGLAILLVILAAISLLCFVRQMSDNYNDTSKSTLGTANEFADWKTYRNEEYGFEIKYPPLESVQFSIQDIDYGYEKRKFLDLTYWSNDLGSVVPGFGMAIVPNKEDLELTEYFNKYVDPTKTLINNGNFKLKLINGTEMYSLVKTPLTDEYFAADLGPICSHFIMSPDNKYIFISFCPGEDKILDHGTREKILSTFKFIPSTNSGQVSTSTAQTIDTTDWRTYRNSDLEVEFKVPNNWKSRQYLNQINFSESSHDKLVFSTTNQEDKINVSSLMIGDIYVTRYEVFGYAFGGINYAFEDKGKLYNFEILNLEDEDILKKIISTFKFTK